MLLPDSLLHSNAPEYVNDHADRLKRQDFYLSIKTSSQWDPEKDGWRHPCTPTELIINQIKHVTISDHDCRHFDSCKCRTSHFVWPHEGKSTPNPTMVGIILVWM